jgi:hypothetical protein
MAELKRFSQKRIRNSPDFSYQTAPLQKCGGASLYIELIQKGVFEKIIF